MLASAEAQKVDDHDQMNCLIKHLKSARQLEANYLEFEKKTDKICKDEVKAVQDKIYKEAALTFRTKPELAPLTKCIMVELRKHFYAEDMMKKTVYLSSQTLEHAENTKIVDMFDNANNETVNRAITSCSIMHDLTEHFDSLAGPKNTSEIEREKEIREYCARKHVVDKNLTTHTIIVNPKNIDITAVNCDEINRSAFKTHIDEFVAMFKHADSFGFNSNQVKCALEMFRGVNYIDRLVAAIVVRQLDITEAEKKTAHESFIAFSNAELAKLSSNCE